MKKISILSAFFGTLLEVYEFSVFAFLIPFISEVFFLSTSSQAINFTLLAYVISYVVKPLGAITFGFLMDIYGRKKILLMTTLLMMIATVTIGLLSVNMPNMYRCWFLIGCRVIQGLSISGEFSAAIIMSVEQGHKRPGFFGSIVFIGGSLGLLLANFSAYLLLKVVPHEQIVNYGWRIPFLISTVFWFILFIIRKNIEDIILVKQAEKGNQGFLYGNKLALINIFIISSLSTSAFYITFVFMPTFLSLSLHLHTYQSSILITLICLVAYVLALPLSGLLADAIGIIKQIKIAASLYIIFAYVCFLLLPHLNKIACLLTLLFFTVIQSLLNAALPAFMVLQFDPIHRGKALAFSYNISLILFGGLMPYLILTNETHVNPGIPISIFAILTLIMLNFCRGASGYLRS